MEKNNIDEQFIPSFVDSLNNRVTMLKNRSSKWHVFIFVIEKEKKEKKTVIEDSEQVTKHVSNNASLFALYSITRR